MANENTWHSRLTGKRWSGCGSHGVYCIPSSFFSPLMSPSKSFLLQRMNVLELLPLKAVGFPLCLRAKAKATPLWRRLFQTSRFQCLAGMFSRLVMAFGQRHLSPRTWAGTTNLSHADHKTTIT